MNEAQTTGETGAAALTDKPITVLAPAKINLFLHIVGRREDGHHELESIFAFADVGDRVSITRADAFSLSLSGPYAGDLGKSYAGDSENLVLRAAKLLAGSLGSSAFPVKLELEKNLPVAAGIGGGSADAAASLRGLLALWGARPPADIMQDLVLALGADVPACLDSVTSRVTGIGEIVKPCPAPVAPLHAVLVNPHVQLSTAAVFARYQADASGLSDHLEKWPDRSDQGIVDALTRCRNDLSDAAVGEAPVVAQVLEELKILHGCRLARMSGSGATCFGLFDNRSAAAQAARELTGNHPDWWVKATVLGAERERGGLV